MATYSAIIGVFIRTYAKFEFEAASDAEAIPAAIAKFARDDRDIAFEDEDYENATQPAIVSITHHDDNRDIEGVEVLGFCLHEQDAKEYAAEEMLDALLAVKSTVHFQVMSVPLQQQIIAAIEAAKMENRLHA